MARGNSPGLDGLTSEVFRTCWHFMEGGYFSLICHFWATGELYLSFNEGILKLLPKKADKRRINDWRPIALLTTAYKLVAKLISLRLRKVLHKIVSPRQTGFILGRQILDNISITCLAFDWVEQNGKLVLFMKLDFEKAFDRLDFKYIWATLTKMGLGGTFLTLVRGLIQNATTKIHINGLFPEEIKNWEEG